LVKLNKVHSFDLKELSFITFRKRIAVAIWRIRKHFSTKQRERERQNKQYHAAGHPQDGNSGIIS